ncbi:thermonuclease family protein [Hansschlegelia sp.]|uniref:thermonuclease family protein n=1 Tax=Hansschlegelia sp. TaxID=2041892 RepID=UPI002C64944B|nr:thermonuclease family protein [Hansschlegelia sp.]HVI28258.1 thermonuclease family protein [Hansschlegelia sp.]
MIRIALLIVMLASPALAQEPPGVFADAARTMPETRVVDGDTVVISGERIRLRSGAGPIDAPELGKAKCPLELFRAEASRDRLAALLKGHEPEIVRKGADRYGRTVAVLLVDGKDLGAELVREGHAKPWPKLTKADRPTWCGESR